MKDGGYDIGYGACECFWGTQPGSLVVKLGDSIKTFTGLSVFDAGCGEGKNSLFCAARGATVLGVDVSELAIAHARDQASATGNLSVRFEVSDVRDLPAGQGQYDVVIAYGLFHCFSGREEIEAVCGNLQSAIREGGYFILCAFNDRQQDLSAHPGFSPTLLHHDHYRNLFAEWELIDCTDSDLTETHPHNAIRHTHSMTRLLARKSQ
jgi:2-polyprenyl-3-methyl-5-hydroxy-6-metoxy-1,4-benzoquinol methylase